MIVRLDELNVLMNSIKNQHQYVKRVINVYVNRNTLKQYLRLGKNYTKNSSSFIN